MGRGATNNPKLLISPPIFNANTAPSKLQYNSGKNGGEKKNEEHPSIIANLRNDKFIGKEADSGKHAIGNKRDGCDWINNGVDVSQPLQKLQSSIVTIPDRTMSTKQNFH